MARTKGSGWGGGVLLYQTCPYCGKKKAYYTQITDFGKPFKCVSCKERFNSDKLLRFQYVEQLKKSSLSETQASPSPENFDKGDTICISDMEKEGSVSELPLSGSQGSPKVCPYNCKDGEIHIQNDNQDDWEDCPSCSGKPSDS